MLYFSSCLNHLLHNLQIFTCHLADVRSFIAFSSAYHINFYFSHNLFHIEQVWVRRVNFLIIRSFLKWSSSMLINQFHRSHFIVFFERLGVGVILRKAFYTTFQQTVSVLLSSYYFNITLRQFSPYSAILTIAAKNQASLKHCILKERSNHHWIIQALSFLFFFFFNIYLLLFQNWQLFQFYWLLFLILLFSFLRFYQFLFFFFTYFISFFMCIFRSIGYCENDGICFTVLAILIKLPKLF